ncbi:hypothetical protein K2173_009168 [Erythroxylum novogranatense]|uniref:Protein kinase domain-containing protein n=1 Tax=Erythroxylum novogranatense TaxID=1862640 RepID=A0AAV8TEW9_9ROSI|nr:hypothetical protein K2173_009168 [Erythroxylum novogranatense]
MGNYFGRARLPVAVEDGPANIVTFTLKELFEYTDGFDDKNFLGYGGFGSVYRGIIRGRKERHFNGLQVAVKVSRNVEIKMRTQWEAEIKYLGEIRHPNIIKLIGCCESVDKFYLVYPLMQNGNVMSKLQDLDWASTIKILTGTARAVGELHAHSPPLIYRDLKPQNLLMDKDFTPKLADFGTVTAEGERLKLGTAGYTDPLVMTDGAVGSKPNDIYSLGVIILQMIMKERIVRFPGSSMQVHISDWARSSYDIKGDAVNEKLKRKGCTKTAAKAITELGLDCVSDNPLERPTIAQVLERLAKLK